MTGLPPDKVEIRVPLVSGRTAEERQANADRVRKLICTTGALEFRIVATNRDNVSLIEMAKEERMKFSVHYDKIVYIKDPKTGKDLAKWCHVRPQQVDKIKDDEAAMVVGTIKVKDSDGKDMEKEAWEVLVLSPESEAYDVTGADIREERGAAIDAETASPQIYFAFNAAGGAKFGRLTNGEHVPVGNFRYKLAIVLDGVVQNGSERFRAQSPIKGAHHRQFHPKSEVDDIVKDLERWQPACRIGSRRPSATRPPRVRLPSTMFHLRTRRIDEIPALGPVNATVIRRDFNRTPTRHLSIQPAFQFSLRTLLLLFVVLGSSLAVFGTGGILVFWAGCRAGDLRSRSQILVVRGESCVGRALPDVPHRDR